MGTTLTESESFDINVQGPTTASVSNSAEMRAELTKILNRSRYLLERLQGVHYTAAAAGNWVRVQLTPLSYSATQWDFSQISGSTALGWKQLDNTSPEPILFHAHIPVNKGVIRAAHAVVSIDTGHAGVPAILPNLKLYRNQWEDDTITQLGSADVSAAASVGAYETVNSCLISGLSESFEAPEPSGTTAGMRDYILAFNGEDGANALIGKVFLIGLQLNITPS